MPSQTVSKSSTGESPFKQGPREWLRRTAGAAAPFPDERGSVPPKAHAVTSVGATFEWPVRVYWEDTDAGGIVFYANYLKFFERSRTEWLRSLGIEQQKLKDSTGGMFIVAETNLRYLRPARLDDELIVTANLIETGRASIIIGQQVLLKSEHLTTVERGEESALLCHGTIRIGWVDAASLQPKRIPESIIESLRAQK